MKKQNNVMLDAVSHDLCNDWKPQQQFTLLFLNVLHNEKLLFFFTMLNYDLIELPQWSVALRDSNVMGNYLLVKGRSQPKMTNKQALREMIIHNEEASWQQKKLCHTRARESDNYSIFS